MEAEPKLIQMTIFTCKWCGKPLQSKRSDARTHNLCRQKMHRWAQRQEKLGHELLANLDALGNYLKFPETNELAIVQFEAIEKMLLECYKAAGIVRRTR